MGGPLVGETEKTKREKRRRDEDRRLYEELSRFYSLPEKDGVKVMWERPSLLREGKNEFGDTSCEEHPAYPRFSQC